MQAPQLLRKLFSVEANQVRKRMEAAPYADNVAVGSPIPAHCDKGFPVRAGMHWLSAKCDITHAADRLRRLIHGANGHLRVFVGHFNSRRQQQMQQIACGWYSVSLQPLSHKRPDDT